MRPLTLGPKTGECNICRSHGTLTEDHIPPKGAIRITQMEMLHLIQVLSAPSSSSKGRLSQDGVKFRTLTDYVFVRSTYPSVFASVVGYGLNLSPNYLVFRKIIERWCSMVQLDQSGLLSRLADYPFSAHCFASYVRWITSNASDGWENYDVIRILDEGDVERLRLIESRLSESRDILGLSEKEFVSAFGFTNDLLSDDPEKVHDVLAEPLLVVDLVQHGFSSISKLPPFIRTDSGKLRNADFLACHGPTKFAIELKTIRMENNPKPEPGRPMGNATKPYWWGTMFWNNAKTKIEDKDRRAVEQLVNAKRNYQVDKTLLVLYTRRLGPSTLMTRDDYVTELQKLLQRYPELDHIGCKDYFGDVTICPQP